ncbi:hypothetical protein SUGI_0331390 [Cryptomeria japonica]|uniref:EID1-like F-box protein 2 n=1 Tax=Cryptomeria japonica TaxID=3369 RepID=UPI0024089C25|nr:EID1-like F-box protein 2 [Cryptomeria japonica]XP_057823267.1 EID1-like F-box protein 2 [Cryptomeria japonica]XP_057823268.1 EID1-like F-box protein 2 [Cryptomeria japonica]XP_057823269.1 EID1-like F-box protein 2 [Cryptomeria japonica]XP_057823270.1 EID1-like F-box protein 2 [Cryptomeria japonica]XP_057823271.1 EID1-like F-box protein 2 [Cryptomeria japonica]XP_057823272.1 EID1-like F-box protein 2 [Cryptomeria japonica]XP_057823273.1 EID1-like F-box protein 2 [Cryptomeria japonica]XP_
MLVKRSHCIHSGSCICTNGHLSETVLVLVFKSLNWNPRTLCSVACVCKWFEDIAKRILWKEFCLSRAPKMVSDLLSGGSHGTIDGNWNALGKLMIYCSGCHDGNNICQSNSIAGHFVYRTRFSRTSGKSFLVQQCRTDTLYVTDPCEHLDQGEDGDVGLFRGIFKAFGKSKVRKMLIERQVELHPKESCPYCRTKVWSMVQANMISRSAYRRLGAYEDQIEYFVCLNGHLLGVCTLLPLSDSETASEEE